jgi:CheY-like chemotaxis protein
MAKILVFDDSKLMREFTSGPLREAGHEVLGVEPESLFEALKQINEFGPDVVLTDYQMPKCNGESLVRAIRHNDKFKHIKIMMITAIRDPELFDRMKSTGVDGFLYKGSDLKELPSRVNALL